MFEPYLKIAPMTPAHIIAVPKDSFPQESKKAPLKVKASDCPTKEWINCLSKDY